MKKRPVISREEAKQRGLKRYYLDEPCRLGHYGERYTSTAVCLECLKTYNNSSGGKICRKNYRHSAKGRRHRLFEKARIRAKKKGLEFSITTDDIVIPKLCPLLGIELQLSGDGLFNVNSPSLDRIDNSKGYVKGNVAVISLKANKLKSNLSLNELKSLAIPVRLRNTRRRITSYDESISTDRLGR